MNRERARELLPIIQAFVEGKTVQWRWCSSGYMNWHDVTELDLDDSVSGGEGEYRIKPEPREFLIAEGDHKTGDRVPILMPSDKALSPLKGDWIKVREVLE